MKKVVNLVVSGFNPMIIKETVDEILEAKNKAIKEGGDQADLLYTRVDEDGTEYKASCLVALYRSVYETKLVEKPKK